MKPPIGPVKMKQPQKNMPNIISSKSSVPVSPLNFTPTEEGKEAEKLDPNDDYFLNFISPFLNSESNKFRGSKL